MSVTVERIIALRITLSYFIHRWYIKIYVFPPYTLDKHFKYLYFKSASLSWDSVDLLCACSCKMFFFITLMSVCTKIVLFQTYVTYVEHGSV